jgi:hypothetical protein
VKIKRTLFIEGSYYQIEQEHSFRGYDFDGWYSVWSVALVCPGCVRVWAMLTVAEAQRHVAVNQYCARCRPAKDEHWLVKNAPPGSILHEEGLGVIDTALLEALPDVLLKREFELHLASLERELQREETSPQEPGGSQARSSP